jgi:hypothetical protein
LLSEEQITTHCISARAVRCMQFTPYLREDNLRAVLSFGHKV